MPPPNLIILTAAVISLTGISGAADNLLRRSEIWEADAERSAAEAQRARAEIAQAGLPSAQESRILDSMTRSQDIAMATLENQGEFIRFMAAKQKSEQKGFIVAIVGLVLTNGLTIYKLWVDRKRQRS